MQNKCPFITARGACMFLKRMKYNCPLLQKSDDLECYDLTDGEFVRIKNLYEGWKKSKEVKKW